MCPEKGLTAQVELPPRGALLLVGGSPGLAISSSSDHMAAGAKSFPGSTKAVLFFSWEVAGGAGRAQTVSKRPLAGRQKCHQPRHPGSVTGGPPFCPGSSLGTVTTCLAHAHSVLGTHARHVGSQATEMQSPPPSQAPRVVPVQLLVEVRSLAWSALWVGDGLLMAEWTGPALDGSAGMRWGQGMLTGMGTRLTGHGTWGGWAVWAGSPEGGRGYSCFFTLIVRLCALVETGKSQELCLFFYLVQGIEPRGTQH